MMDDREAWQRWSTEIERAGKDEKYKTWVERSEKIVKRYRDDREGSREGSVSRRMNILWSNVQTLLPAVYPAPPKPLAERRFLDRDPIGRMASTILERAMSVQMEIGYYDQSVGQAMLDWLLPGLGTVWLRYEPVMEAAQDQQANQRVQSQENEASDVENEGDGVPYERIASERVCVDYVHWRDFRWGAARYWCEVPWVAKRCWMTTSEIAVKFYGGDMEQAKKIVLDYTPDSLSDKDKKSTLAGYFKKAEVWEIWNKADQTVYIFAPSTPNVILKRDNNPVLKLEGFWPTPHPLFSTQTTDTLVPVPDFVEYQDQAMELDDITNRIAALTTALRVNGVYDASQSALERLLQDGMDNRLIPIEDWAKFSEKTGGGNSPIWLIPVKEIAETLIRLYEARDQVKSDMYEVTGMSDIIRGQGDASETATAQRIKGQFASLRLNDRRKMAGNFCREVVRIMAEIIAEMFQPDTLMQISGMDMAMRDRVMKAVQSVPQPQPPQLPPGTPPPPPQVQQQMQMQMQMQYQQAQQQAAQQAQAAFMQDFQQAIALLKSDKMRGFRVDIETDATLEADAQSEKQSAVELLTGTLQALTGAAPIVQMQPDLMKPIGALLMFAFRKFRVGRPVEATLEEALDQMNDQIEAMKGQPPPPSPEQMKAEAEIKANQAQQQAEAQRAQQDHAFTMQQKQADFAVQQRKNAIDIERMNREWQIEQQRMGMEQQQTVLNAAVDTHAAMLDAQAKREQHAHTMAEKKANGQ